jgi:hypothetical protein
MLEVLTQEQHMRLRLSLAALSLFMAAGCSAPSAHTIRDAKADDSLTENTDKGLVIVSTRFSSDCPDGENLFVGLEYQDSYSKDYRANMIPVNDPRLPKDFESPPGHFSVKTFYAGNHRIRRMHLGDTSRETRTLFQVDAGKAVYLGEVHIKVANCGPAPSITTQVTDQWERDSKLFQAKMQNIRPEDVSKRLLGTRPAQQ